MTTAATRPLTRRQAEIFRLIGESVAARGRPPTIRELMAAVGLPNQGGVVCHLRALEAKGFVRIARPAAKGQGHHVACGIEVVGLADLIGGVVRKYVANRIAEHTGG